MALKKCEFLVCPIDDSLLTRTGSSYGCEQGHNFDVAKQGHINLLPVQHKRSRAPGDNQVMVAARKRFLDSGAYEGIAKKLVMRVCTVNDAGTLSVLDAGCGEGYYLAYLREHLSLLLPDIDQCFCGVDISKPAIIAAAKRDRAITWVVGSNKQLPIQAQSMDAVICMFGFPNFEMFKKVLKPEGQVILIDPNTEHLIELRTLLYDEVRKGKLPSHDEALAFGFKVSETSDVTYQAQLSSSQQIVDLAMMTPHYFRAKQEAKDKLGQMDALKVTVSVGIKTFSL